MCANNGAMLRLWKVSVKSIELAFSLSVSVALPSVLMDGTSLKPINRALKFSLSSLPRATAGRPKHCCKRNQGQTDHEPFEHGHLRSPFTVPGCCPRLAHVNQATRDPANPLMFPPTFDGGDHLHPNDAGYEAMANAVDLSLFTP